MRLPTSVIARVVGFFGFSVLILGGSVALLATENAAKVAVSALSAVGVVFASYYAATFFRMHRLANEQLNHYFNQPLVESFHLSAERIALETEDEQLQAPTARESINNKAE